ncbi:hypothetical protein C8F01DRAFT_1127849 [Mycena amicta]|nr:hypothetical protein C8F01DRAFT_1127849 [Mycena amicta]
MEVALADHDFHSEPRAHLDGFELPNNFVLPRLEAVRADAERSLDMRDNPSTYEDIVLFFPPSNPASVVASKQPLAMHLKLALIFNLQVSNLFRFAYFARTEDVPDDILDECIWALGLFIRIMEECTEAVLRALGHVKGNNDYKQSKYLSLLNARSKIIVHLDRLNRYQDALPYAKAAMDDECTRGEEMWLKNPMVFEMYGEVLVLTRADDILAAKMLRRAMRGLETMTNTSGSGGLPNLIQTRTFLARALRNIAADDQAETHEKWLVTWFRKNPRLMGEELLRHMLLPAGPVLEALGGETWLDNRKMNFKAQQRVAKGCRTCGAREPLVTLMRCNNCKYIYYCSKECQKSNWKHHKVECRERAATLEKIERMALTNPSGAARATDWSLWCNSNHDATQFGLIHALGLHRNPARGRTHIVIKQVEYVPTAKKLQYKFRVLSCGVFRITDVLRDIETVMGLDPGEGGEFVDSMFVEIESAGDKVPFIDLSFGDGISAWLGSGATTEGSIRVIPYDPDWRKRFNVGAPPRPMLLRSGAKDVEHVF